MFSFITRHFSNDLAIDLGTANTLIYVKDKGIVLNEPSVVAISEEGGSNKVLVKLAVGSEAKLMLGKVPESIKTIRPMCDGVIADYNITEMMIKDFIHKVHGNRFFNPSPLMIIGVPCGSTPVEKKAIYDAARESGAREVHLIAEPMAAAIGADLPVDEPCGSMIIDIGGGTTEVAIISLGGTVYTNSVRVGGDKFDDAIINYVRRNYGMLIGETTAEDIKKKIGSAFPDSKVQEMEIKGRKISEGIPRSLTITSNEILEALAEPLNQIVNAVKKALEVTPPELGADIAERGMMISGGGALLKNIEVLLREETGLPVHIAEEPLTCVVRGLGKIVENVGRLNRARNPLY